MKSFLCRIGVILLVQDWGDPSFRHIPVIHARMRSHPTMICLTATPLAGQETTNLLNTLGLKPGNFFSNDVPTSATTLEIFIACFAMDFLGGIFLTLTGLSKEIGKTIIYCGNFGLSFRLRVYYHYKDTHKIIRLYDSLCFPCYNSNTCRLFVEDPNTQIFIATESRMPLSLGSISQMWKMAHLASCYPAYEDILYDNPLSDPPCFCKTCSKMPPAITGCSVDVTHSPLYLHCRDRTNKLNLQSRNLQLTDAMVKHETT